MKLSMIVDELCKNGEAHDYTYTCDTYKAGSVDRDVTKVAITMFATVNVLKAAKAWGAELLVTHESTFFNHEDQLMNDPVSRDKKKLVEESGLTIFRFHDHPHNAYPDLIGVGVAEAMGFDGHIEYVKDAYDLVRIELHHALTPTQIARQIEKNLNVRHIRICGNTDRPCKHISLLCGSPEGKPEEMMREGTEVLITGEVCEWSLAEWARDASDLGYNKSLMVMGHVGSERAGMEHIASLLQERFPQIDVQYFDCGEVYTYTD